MKPDLHGRDLFYRRITKGLIYTPLALMNAVRIPSRKAQPTVQFTVEADPPSVYYNFRVKKRRLKAFREYLDLPEHLPLTPIRCLQGEDSDILFTLNAYRVSGITNGLRAEFSTYVSDETGTPRYMVLEARDHTGSMDPINIVTLSSKVEQKRDSSGMTTVVASNNGALFAGYASESQLDNAPYCEIDGEWIEANDYIYWRNGIRDRCYYDGGMANPSVKSLDPTSIDLVNDTHWGEFIEPVPKHVLVYENAINFMILPWENL